MVSNSLSNLPSNETKCKAHSNKMNFKTYLFLWTSYAFLLTFLLINEGNTWFLGRRRTTRSPKPTAKPAPVINCGGWSEWSECTPFCGLNPKRSRTGRIRRGVKCVDEKQESECQPLGGCSDFCVNNQCTCRPGFNLVDGKNCVDIDECKSNQGRGPCSQECTNYPGNFACYCNTGYLLIGKTDCTLEDCLTPKFSPCPSVQTIEKAQGYLLVCTNITATCENGTTYNSQCILSCPKNYQLALKKPGTNWSDYTKFDFPGASSSIICHESEYGEPEWHTQLAQYYCRRRNDPPLSIKLTGNSIKEQLPPGSIVGKLSTTDAQQAQLMVFSVQTNEGKPLFRCNGSILQTSMTFTWTPHGQNSHPVRIRAQDNGSPPMWREQVFNISIENVNDPPRKIEISKNWVSENASVNTVVGELSAIDDDLGNYRTSNFSWKLLADNCGNFNITDNKVVVQKTLNYHTVKLCHITVACFDGSVSAKQQIPIYIKNFIDPPTLTLTGNSTAENSKVGTVITQIISKSESNKDLNFSISQTDPNGSQRFGLSLPPVCEHSKAKEFNTTCYVNITVSGQLDYETTEQYTLDVYVWNDDSSNFKKWYISVKNVNEKPDELEMIGDGKVAENTKSGIDIDYFWISDPDNRNGMTQNHSCHVITSAGNKQYFQVNKKNSLQVKENISLNYEKRRSYIVTVQCNDSGLPSLGITKKFIINVTDTDEPIQNLTLSNNKVNENSEIGTEVGKLDAYDPDIHRPKIMTFSLIDPKNSPFTLKGKSNQILVVNGSLNFEEKSVYYLTIRVTDTVGRHLQTPFIINIKDVEEAPTDIIVYKQLMKENQEPGSFISNITMIDEDKNTMTSCKLLNDAEGRIALNETTLIAGEKMTDYEQELSHMIEISLQCCDQSKACYEKRFNITVEDVNEQPTDIIIDKLEVMENVKNITIGRITVADPDKNSEYHCYFSSDNQTEHSYLRIINQTLRLVKELDFEKNPRTTFEISCREKGNTSMSFTKTFYLTVKDLNEAPSEGCQMPLYISHEQSIGTVLGNLNVTDPDNENDKDKCNPTQILTYEVISEKKLPFQIFDGYLVKTGEVVVNTTYNFKVSVRDNGDIQKTTVFNCTVISRKLVGPQITLSSNQIQEGFPNASVIGYLDVNNETQHKMRYEIMKECNDYYPFVIEDNRLMLILSSYPEPTTDDDYIIPQYTMVMVTANDANTTGHQISTRFAIFIKDNIKTRKLICFSNNPVELDKIASVKLGPVIIYYDNNTDEQTCPNKKGVSLPPYYKCYVKANMKQSSESFAKVNFTNALYIDREMFLTVNISIRETKSALNKLVLDLFCWKPDQFYLFVKGSIEIPLTHTAVCEDDHQPRNENLCENKPCSEDTICSKVINAGKRCVPTVDQLYVIVPTFSDAFWLCEFEKCLQEMLGNQETSCLSKWNEQRREKRNTQNSLYVDTLKIDVFIEKKQTLLRLAIWEIQGETKLKLKKPTQFQSKLNDKDDIIFITTKEKCDDLLNNTRIKCPVEHNENEPNKRSETALDSPKIQAALGVGVAIIVAIILIIVLYCLRKRKHNKKVKRTTPVGDFSNMAFDDTELKELPPVPKEGKRNSTWGIKKRSKKRTPKYDFKNPAYEDPMEVQSRQSNASHIYNEAGPPVSTYEQPELLAEKSHDKNKVTTKAISNPFYEATDVIPVQQPLVKCAGNDTNSNDKISTANVEPQYETLPHLQDPKSVKKGFFGFSKQINQNKMPDTSAKEFYQDNKNIIKSSVDCIVGDKDGREECSITKIKEPHYEELPLPTEDQIDEWKQQFEKNAKEQGIVSNCDGIKIKEGNKNKISKSSTYEDIPPLQDEKKKKGLFRFSKVFNKNHDEKHSNQKTDCINSTKLENNRFSNQNEMINQGESMLNPRDKVKKDDPASKYPFYEELPPVQNSKQSESVHSNKDVTKVDRNSASAAYYHVLEQNPEETNQEIENNEFGPKYFILEKSNSTSDENKKYQSLHRELDPPPPTYESYRMPQKSGSESGKQNLHSIE